MITISARLTGTIQGDLNRIQQQLATYPDRALREFRTVTPIRTGNARRRTQLRGQVIDANYPYAERLDQGWSDQAPQGMTEPMQAWREREIKRLEAIANGR